MLRLAEPGRRPISWVAGIAGVGFALRPSVCRAGCAGGLDCVDLIFGSTRPGLPGLLFCVVIAAGFVSGTGSEVRSATRATLVAGGVGAGLLLLVFSLELPFVLFSAGVPLAAAGWLVATSVAITAGLTGRILRPGFLRRRP